MSRWTLNCLVAGAIWMPLHMRFRHFCVAELCVTNLTGQSIIATVLFRYLWTCQPTTGSKFGVGMARSNLLEQFASLPIALTCAPLVKENLELVVTSLTSGHEAIFFSKLPWWKGRCMQMIATAVHNIFIFCLMWCNCCKAVGSWHHIQMF